jgi:hypothetical protein
MANTLEYHITAERPDAVLTLPDDLDVTSGYTFSVRIGRRGQEALLDKTTGITGGDGFVTVSWTAGELASIGAAGGYLLTLTVTTGGLDRVYECGFGLTGVVVEPSP